MTVTPGTTLTQGQSASVNLNIVNDGTTTFTGQYQVNLYNLDGTFVQTISTINESTGLPSGYTYQNPYLTFSTSSISAVPGTYLLAAVHKPSGSPNFQLTGSSYFLNPIKVTVKQPTIQPDQYETNNNQGQAFTLPIAFSGNTAIRSTVGSNCHLGSDYDYYKINLPAGYTYSISPRLHDSYNSSNGNTYTLDALFSYSTDGITWSDAFDDLISGNISANGGGTLYFHVAPFFAGETGTYLLDMAINRTLITGANEVELSNSVMLYPNPSNGKVTLDFTGIAQNVTQINILNIQGQSIYTKSQPKNQYINQLDLSDYPEGIYTIQFQTLTGVLNKKLILKK
jgi:hypothetical protein